MKKKSLLIIIGILLVLLIIGIVIAIVFVKKGEEEPEEEVTKITIKFETDGGEPVEDLEVEKNEKVTLPTTVKDGFNFLGWYKEDEKMEDEVKFKKDTTLTAKWEKIPEKAKTMEVSFNTNGGNSIKTITMECGKPLTLPANPTKSGYKFVSWADKKGKVISKGANLACENITLYANWEKEEEKKEPEPVKKEYTCPDGYTLNGTKCTQTVAAKEKCPDGTKADGNLCIKTSDANGGTRVCKSDTVAINGKGQTWTGKGDYYYIPNAYGKCAYYKWEAYTTESACTGANDIYHKTTWVSYLNGCYAETKMNNYETVCDSDYQWYSSADLSSKFGIHDNGKCLKKVDKVKYCESGFTLDVGNCVKTIDATEK
jgi:uncharacterized repeat protein (TIGR02543 family)